MSNHQKKVKPKAKGAIFRIRERNFGFDEEKAREREDKLKQKYENIKFPGTNPVKREIYEHNYFEKKKKLTIENGFLKNSLETNPYYMKEGDYSEEGVQDNLDDKSEGSGSNRSTSKDSKYSKIQESGRDFFERNNLQATKGLSKYDCWDQDLTPEEWIEKWQMYPERTHGRCPFFINGKYVWRPVKVLNYEPEQKKYLVKNIETGVQKKIERLSLLFDDEDKNLFRDRVQQCKYYQKRAEDEMRFQNYANSIQDSKGSTLPIEWVDNIIAKTTLKKKKTKDDDYNYTKMVINNIIKTVEAEFLREMKKCFVISEMQNKYTKDKFSQLKIDLRREIIKVNYLGTIGNLPNDSYFGSFFNNIKEKHLNKEESISS